MLTWECADKSGKSSIQLIQTVENKENYKINKTI